MAQKNLNYAKICAYELCGKEFIANRRTAKYCCSQHNALAWHMRNGTGKAMAEIEESRQKQVEVLHPDSRVQNNLRGTSISTVQTVRYTTIYNQLVDKQILYPHVYTERMRSEELLLDEEFADDLRFGVGVHYLNDRFGNRLYLVRPVIFYSNYQLEFLNFELNRVEEWFLGRSGSKIKCTYRYSNLKDLWLLENWERMRNDGLEREERHLKIRRARQLYDPHHVYGVELTEELIQAGLLKLTYYGGDDYEYNILTGKEVNDFFDSRQKIHS